MANDEISDICPGGIEKGENHRQSMILYENIRAGMAVYKVDADNVGKCDASHCENFYGLVKSRRDVDLDTDIGSGISADIIRDGYSCAFIDDPGVDMDAGELLHASGTTAGSLHFYDPATDELDPVAQLVEDMSNGDTVGIVKIF